jgi:pimeloyl-ACP methyl ester carboxylesterase
MFVSASLAKRQPARVDAAVVDSVSKRSAFVFYGFAQQRVLLDKAFHALALLIANLWQFRIVNPLKK